MTKIIFWFTVFKYLDLIVGNNEILFRKRTTLLFWRFLSLSLIPEDSPLTASCFLFDVSSTIGSFNPLFLATSSSGTHVPGTTISYNVSCCSVKNSCTVGVWEPYLILYFLWILDYPALRLLLINNLFPLM